VQRSGAARPEHREPAADGVGAAALWWLAGTIAAYGVLHHVGSGLAWAGTVGVTRWADWLDLLTPYAVLLPAAVSLRLRGPVGLPVWAVYAAGAVTYVEGHGIHLAANSIGNVAPGPAAHLWDEVVGHYLWYSGWILVLTALAMAFGPVAVPRGPLPYALAILLGGTAATNALEGGTAVLGLASAGAFVVAGWLGRHGLRRMLVVAYVPTIVVLIGYGLWHGGFPQPSQLAAGVSGRHVLLDARLVA
jgi:hypothetical protein